MSILETPAEGEYDFYAVVLQGAYKHHLVFVDGSSDDDVYAICFVCDNGAYNLPSAYVLIPYSYLLELPPLENIGVKFE
jgi:hypothetical protein